MTMAVGRRNKLVFILSILTLYSVYTHAQEVYLYEVVSAISNPMKLPSAVRKVSFAEFVWTMIATINRICRNATAAVQRIVHRIAMHQQLVPQRKRVRYFRINVSFMCKIMKLHEDVYQVWAIKSVRVKKLVRVVPMVNCVTDDRLMLNVVTHVIRWKIQIATKKQSHIGPFHVKTK